jgi:hypothetical protein
MIYHDAFSGTMRACVLVQLAPKFVEGSDHRPSPQEMYEELWSFRTSKYHILPSWRGYTLLVPTLAEIQQLTTNLEMGATTEAKTLFTLLLHIIPERLFTADLLAFARPSTFLHARLRT